MRKCKALTIDEDNEQTKTEKERANSTKRTEREREREPVTYEPSSHSGSTKSPPDLTPGSHDFLPLNLGLAVTFLVAMAVMREQPLPTPNDTDGDKRRPLLLLTPTVPFTKDDLDTAAVSCDTDALLATAIATDRRFNTVLVFFFLLLLLLLVLVLLLLLLVAKLEQKKPPAPAKPSKAIGALHFADQTTTLCS